MTFALPDPATEFGARVARRLHQDKIAWLTTVDHAGMPQLAPVWFLWDQALRTALVYSQPTAKRLARMHTNPATALHLNDDGAGHDFALLTGRITTATDVEQADRNPRYLEKYEDWMIKLFGSTERFAGMFSVPVLFLPERIRGH
jgi:PPOX class probable F420-dependent enzyme